MSEIGFCALVLIIAIGVCCVVLYEKLIEIQNKLFEMDMKIIKIQNDLLSK